MSFGACQKLSQKRGKIYEKISFFNERGGNGHQKDSKVKTSKSGQNHF